VSPNQKNIERIKKLLQLADTQKNSNVEEAASAAAMAQALMEKYRIAEAMLDTESVEEVKCKLLLDEGAPQTWKVLLANILAKSNGCYIVCQTDDRVTLIGEDRDIEVIQSIYKYLSKELSLLCINNMVSQKALVGAYPGSKYVEGFYLGAITTIDKRLKSTNLQVRKEEYDNASTTEEIELLKTALSKLDTRLQKAEDWVKDNLEVKIDKVKIDNINYRGYQAGRAAGDSVSLTPDMPELGSI